MRCNSWVEEKNLGNLSIRDRSQRPRRMMMKTREAKHRTTKSSSRPWPGRQEASLSERRPWRDRQEANLSKRKGWGIPNTLQPANEDNNSCNDCDQSDPLLIMRPRCACESLTMLWICTSATHSHSTICRCSMMWTRHFDRLQWWKSRGHYYVPCKTLKQTASHLRRSALFLLTDEDIAVTLSLGNR